METATMSMPETAFNQEFGQDTVMYTQRLVYFGEQTACDMVYVNLHLSNKNDKFIEQLMHLNMYILSNPHKVWVLFGDFNSKYFVKNNTVYFIDKDANISSDGQWDEKDVRAEFGYPATHYATCSNLGNFPTTIKTRFETNQGAKMLKPVQAAIDGCIVFWPTPLRDASYELDSHINVNVPAECYTSNGKVSDPNANIALDWCSDHYALSSTLEFSTQYGQLFQKKVCSLNVCGESLCGKVSFNHLEFMPESLRKYMDEHPEVAARIQQIIDAQPSVLGKSFRESFEGKDVSKELRTCSVFDVHPFPYGDLEPELAAHFQTTRTKFEEEFQKYMETATEKQRLYGDAVFAFRDQLHNDELLQPLILAWFRELTQPKITFDEVLEFYVNIGDYDVIGLQEVNTQMAELLRSNRALYEKYGYRLVIPEEFSTKTCGAMLVKV